MTEESPLAFPCASETLIGIAHAGDEDAETGVVIVVGGPQYRVGSHRQFVLTARDLAAAGIPVLRFDYRGMGDAEGLSRDFEMVGEDISAAIDCFAASQPTLKNFVLYGLCDAASAILMYAAGDQRISRLILLNPWVHTAQGEAKTYLRHYYLQRFFERSFWRKIFHGEFSLGKSLSGILRSVRVARSPSQTVEGETEMLEQSFLVRMREGLEQFKGETLLLISGRDLTAQQFTDLCKGDRQWRKALRQSQVTTVEFPQADHTMSARVELNAANETCIKWLTE